MRMNKQQYNLVWNRIKSKIAIHDCPFCKVNLSLGGVSLHDILFQNEQYGNGIRMYGGPVLPVVVLACNNCAYLMNFAANMLGIIDPRTSGLIEV